MPNRPSGWYRLLLLGLARARIALATRYPLHSVRIGNRSHPHDQAQMLLKRHQRRSNLIVAPKVDSVYTLLYEHSRQLAMGVTLCKLVSDDTGPTNERVRTPLHGAKHDSHWSNRTRNAERSTQEHGPGSSAVRRRAACRLDDQRTELCVMARRTNNTAHHDWRDQRCAVCGAACCGAIAGENDARHEAQRRWRAQPDAASRGV